MGGPGEDVWVTESAGHDGRGRCPGWDGRFVIDDVGQGCYKHGHVVPRYAGLECLVVENADIFPDSHQQGDIPAALRAHHPAEQLARRSPPSVSTI